MIRSPRTATAVGITLVILGALPGSARAATPEPPKVVAPPPQVRVEGQAAPAAEPEMTKAEQDELAAALAELEAEEQRDQARMKR